MVGSSILVARYASPRRCSANWEDLHEPGRSDHGPAVTLYSFGHVCQFELGKLPAVIAEKHEQVAPVRQYAENVRRARWEGRLRGTRRSS